MVPTTTVGYVECGADLSEAFKKFCEVGSYLGHPAAIHAMKLLTDRDDMLQNPQWTTISRITSTAILLAACDKERDPMNHDVALDALLNGHGPMITLGTGTLRMCVPSLGWTWIVMRKRKNKWLVSVETYTSNVEVLTLLHEKCGQDMTFPDLPPEQPNQINETLH